MSDWTFAEERDTFDYQHGVTFTPEGSLLSTKMHESNPDYTRSLDTLAVREYALDCDSRTLTEVFSFGEDQGIAGNTAVLTSNAIMTEHRTGSLMSPQPSVDDLLRRMGRELSAQLFPFVVVSIIRRAGSATPAEIAAALGARSSGKLDFSDRSLAHLLGRLEKTFGLIERTSSGECALSDKGEALYAETLAQVIAPLQGVLPDAG